LEHFGTSRDVHGVDAPALTISNGVAGYLMFVFTNEHTDAEIGLDTGDFGNYDADIDRALQFLYPDEKRMSQPKTTTANEPGIALTTGGAKERRSYSPSERRGIPGGPPPADE